MDHTTRTHLDNLTTGDSQAQNQAYHHLLAATSQPVDWANEVWDELVAHLGHKDNHVRAIASQVLCSLAISDPEERMLRDFDALLAVTRDERFVTARHCLQALWKVGLAGPAQQALLLEGFERRFRECQAEKNCTLIRFDIIQGLRHLYDAVQDEKVKEKALALIATEDDLKYRKKYASVWKGQPPAAEA